MSSGFITEAEIEERRKTRQEQWEKVRKPEDPVAPPEEPVDHRSLYDRLQEQKLKKQEEYEEAHKLKNMVRKGLDDDEADFLEAVDKAKMDQDKQKRMEEMKALNEFRSKMAELREEEIEKHIKQELGLVKTEKKKSFDDEVPSIGTRKTTQSKLLAGVIKRKAPAPDTSVNTNEVTKKPKTDGTTEEKPQGESSTVIINSSKRVLPGLASYSDSSNSEDDDSSDSERGSSVPRDLCGREIVHQGEEEESDGNKKKK